MPEIKVTPLGAGQDVGRSCLLLSMGGKNIMLDCGMHMGFNDERRFPDFSYIVPEGPITSHIDCVIISHFHLENSGALPYMSEVIGYNGPIYMTPPTKAIVPILLEGLRKVSLTQQGKRDYLTTQLIKNCMKKVTAVDLHQSIMVDNELEIKAYYAGHVLGAAMFWIKVGSQTVVYTGDFNMNPDRHLGAAWIDKCQPDLLITESIYATASPNPKRCRNRDFVKTVHDCMSRGGKVLIPVFLLGRSQELCILLDAYWKKHNLSYPIYFAVDSMTEKSNSYYNVFSKWTNQKMDKPKTDGDIFDFEHIKRFERSYIDDPGPMVVLATDGMLVFGLSLLIFKKWADDENNLVILPDSCMKGTLGYRLLAGAKEVKISYNEVVKVQLKVVQMNFDAVADAKGIIQLIQKCAPKNVILTHRYRTIHENLDVLCSQIKEQNKVVVHLLLTGDTCTVETRLKLPTEDSLDLLKKGINTCKSRGCRPTPIKRNSIFTIHVAEENRIIMINVIEACKDICMLKDDVVFCGKYKFDDPDTRSKSEDKIYTMFKTKLKEWNVKIDEDLKVTIESVKIELVPDEEDPSQKCISISWNNQDEDIAMYIIEVLYNLS
ncbi:integrator complex subunit 11 isoform X1 [Episyrphus balteatus]|uniref:integrator complex subunit 11 isoform X1 n=1 Tax=Episyrphus balteatus TaxID=286459 RepID=UPI0024857B76|nr:integrator complex subunit 11 isoform X1 [Episyrphus balteatus]